MYFTWLLYVCQDMHIRSEESQRSATGLTQSSAFGNQSVMPGPFSMFISDLKRVFRADTCILHDIQTNLKAVKMRGAKTCSRY